MTRRRTKICGITRAEDARLSARLGADAIGLNFYPPSPRCIEPARVTKIVDRLPAFVTVVALFVNPTDEQVKAVLETGRIQCLQFHGDESLAFCQSFGVPYIKAFQVRDLDSARRQLKPFYGNCSVVLDTYVPGERGGTGESFDWQVGRSLVEDGRNEVILAGGLTPDNVGAAIEAVAPYGVDICSGVESSPGVKDPELMRRFFTAVSL